MRLNSALRSLEVVGHLNNVALDTNAIARDYALDDNISFEEIIRAVKDRGFKAKKEATK